LIKFRQTKAEHRLRLFENSVLRRISACVRDEVIGGWRKLHKEELHEVDGCVARM
jgi:hypothetical protein